MKIRWSYLFLAWLTVVASTAVRTAPSAARGESLAAFDGRCILAGCVALPSNIPDILGHRALPSRRLARLGATPDFHHGLLAGASVAAEKPTLADAVEQRDRALVRTLLEAGADVNAAQVDGMTALHWAVYNDDAETAGRLVRSGANVNAANRYGVPPLSLASTNGNADLVKLLLEAGANANASLPGGETVLMTAARAGNPEAVK